MSERQTTEATDRQRERGDADKARQPTAAPLGNGFQSLSSYPLPVAALLGAVDNKPDASPFPPIVPSQLLALQRAHGNQYVQRLMKSAVRTDGGRGASPDGDEGPIGGLPVGEEERQTMPLPRRGGDVGRVLLPTREAAGRNRQPRARSTTDRQETFIAAGKHGASSATEKRVPGRAARILTVPAAIQRSIASITSRSAHLRDYDKTDAGYVVKEEKLIGYEIKRGDELNVEAPEVRDKTGKWLLASFGDAQGFVRADKVSYRPGGQQRPYLYHVYPSPQAKAWEMVRQKRLEVSSIDKKKMKAAAESARAKDLYKAWKDELEGDPMLRFVDEHLRVDVAYTRNQLTEMGGLYASIAFAGSEQDPAAVKGAFLEQKLDLAAANRIELEKRRAGNQSVYEQALRAMRAFDYSTFDETFTEAALDAIEGNLDTMNAAEVIQALLDTYKGFLIVEQHQDPDSKQFLMENIQGVMGAAVNTIYVEHIRFGEYQHLVDEYLSSAPESPMPTMLAKFLASSDRSLNLHGPNNLTGLVQMAKKRGVRVVGIDDTAGQTLGKQERPPTEWGEERVTRMNYIAQQIINDDQEKHGGGKYAVLLGAAHAHTHIGVERGVAGMSQLLNVPALKVEASKRSRLVLTREEKTKRLGTTRPSGDGGP